MFQTAGFYSVSIEGVLIILVSIFEIRISDFTLASGKIVLDECEPASEALINEPSQLSSPSGSPFRPSTSH